MTYLLYQTVCWSACLASSAVDHRWQRAAFYTVLLALCLAIAPLAAIEEEQRASGKDRSL